MGDDCLSWGIEAREEDARPATALLVRKTAKCWKRGSMEEEDFISMLHGSDPIKIELTRLENELREKDRELAELMNEIKAQKLKERAKEKVVAEVTEELQKSILKHQALEEALEDKNLEIKRICEEKKAALAAQYAAEATLRRVHAAQKDEELLPIEAMLSPLEAEVKILEQEVAKLQEDNRALERLTKSKELALLDAEKEVQSAKIKAAMVDELLNRNQDLMKQNDICQEEYKILDRMHRQKVAEVEKMAQNIKELEEALLSGAAVANAVRDYQRQVNELKIEKKTLERTLSRVKVAENRAAVVTASEWKDRNDKTIPVKQWTEERRVLLVEMQQLRDKLSVAERTAKAEAQLKEKFQIRMKIIEDSLRSSILQSSCTTTTSTGSPVHKSTTFLTHSTNGSSSKKVLPPLERSISMPRHAGLTLKLVKGASRSFEGGKLPEHEDRIVDSNFCEMNCLNSRKEEANGKPGALVDGIKEDLVAGIFYDVLQREVISLRKACLEKNQGLQDRESAIELLSRKVNTLTKALEVEAKKTQREKAAMVKEIAMIRAEKEQEQRNRRVKGTPSSSPKWAT